MSYRLPKIRGKRLYDPHVVIIGAGASKAACETDKNGKSVPLLREIHKTLGLFEELKPYNFSEQELEDFELLYSHIFGKPQYAQLQTVLEKEVKEYFQSLKLPDNPTLYDYLVLSLTSKDAIISFNWDSFLIQAYKRNRIVGNLPQLFFPHGNTGVGLCYSCHVKGYSGCICNKCGYALEDMQLLYPVGEKNYNDGGIIESEWAGARDYLSRAAGLTIWGYNAPSSDGEAYKLIKEAYLISNVDIIAPFTIINRMNNKEAKKAKWAEIFDNRMLQYTDDFKQTILWNSPRVSLETLFDAILQQKPRSGQKPFTEFDSLMELQSFVQTITEFDMA